MDAQTADGGATFSELLAMLKQLLCVGCVNKALSKILRENLYKLLLCCRNVMHDPGELRKIAQVILVQGVHADDDVCVRHCLSACAMCACA